MIDNQNFYLVKNKINDIKSEMKRQIGDDKIYNDFIKSMLLYSVEDKIVNFVVSSNFIKTTIENNYKELFNDILNNVLHSNFEVKLFTMDEAALLSEKQEKQPQPLDLLNDSNLDLNSTFDNFSVSNFNKSAFNAVSSILKDKNFNPIFIYAGVGLGKSHLLNAVGKEYLKLHPTHIVRYICAGDFQNKIYKAFSSRNQSEVEKIIQEYESCDLLLFDDVQTLDNKEKLNEIFFHIFNNNISHNKIIILCSDTKPELLKNFNNRMISRFCSGLTVEITNPSIDATVGVLDEIIKKQNSQYIWPKESKVYLARRCQNDFRKLGGNFIKINWDAYDNNLPSGSIISINFIQKSLMDEKAQSLKEKGFDIDPDIVINQIALSYGITPEIIKSKTQKKQITQVRHLCMYIFREKFNMTFEQIGKFFGGKAHTTVMEAVEKTKELLDKDENLKKFIENLYKSL